MPIVRQLPAAREHRNLAIVRKILSGIARAHERYGRRTIIAMLVGDTSELPTTLTKLSTIGLLRHERSDTIDQWIDASVSAGSIALSNDQYGTLSLTPHGREVMSGRAESPQIPAPRRLRNIPSRRVRDYRGTDRRVRRFFNE